MAYVSSVRTLFIGVDGEKIILFISAGSQISFVFTCLPAHFFLPSVFLFFPHFFFHLFLSRRQFLFGSHSHRMYHSGIKSVFHTPVVVVVVVGAEDKLRCARIYLTIYKYLYFCVVRKWCARNQVSHVRTGIFPFSAWFCVNIRHYSPSGWWKI